MKDEILPILPRQRLPTFRCCDHLDLGSMSDEEIQKAKRVEGYTHHRGYIQMVLCDRCHEKIVTQKPISVGYGVKKK